MAYEFTKQKISAERKAFVKRLAIAGLGGCVGLAFGVALNDMHSFFGFFRASVLATIAGSVVFFLLG